MAGVMSAGGEGQTSRAMSASSRLERLRCVVSMSNDALPLARFNGIRRYRFCVGAGVDITTGSMSVSGEGLNRLGDVCQWRRPQQAG